MKGADKGVWCWACKLLSKQRRMVVRGGIKWGEVVRPMVVAPANCGQDPQWHYTQCGSAVPVMFTACLSPSTMVIDVYTISYDDTEIRPGAGFLLSLSPERKVERPHSKGFGMGRSLGCPRYGIVCINIISALYVYIYTYIFNLSLLFGTCWCLPPLSYHAGISILITWEESGASALLECVVGGGWGWVGGKWSGPVVTQGIRAQDTCPSSST